MLSILIPTYNYNVLPLAEEISRQAQKASVDFEVIVLDDASPDARFRAENEKINLLENCRHITNSQNLGRTLIRQKLAEIAKFDTLLFLDADVVPSSAEFINKYIPHISKGTPVVLGGYAYRENNDPDVSLRWKYGKNREEKPASERNKRPYGSIFSGNILIKKDVFLQNNYKGQESFYGMDIYFSHQLYRSNIPVVHIDNTIYHLGLEKNEVFFRKSLQAVAMRKKLLGNSKEAAQINSLLKYSLMLEKYRLKGVATAVFRLTAPLLKKLILNKNPSLFCLDIYRLGYICSLK